MSEERSSANDSDTVRNKQIQGWIKFCETHTAAPVTCVTSGSPGSSKVLYTELGPGLPIQSEKEKLKHELALWLAGRIVDLQNEFRAKPEHPRIRTIDFLMALALATGSHMMSIGGQRSFSKREFDKSNEMCVGIMEKVAEIATRNGEQLDAKVIMDALTKSLCSFIGMLWENIDTLAAEANNNEKKEA